MLDYCRHIFFIYRWLFAMSAALSLTTMAPPQPVETPPAMLLKSRQPDEMAIIAGYLREDMISPSTFSATNTADCYRSATVTTYALLSSVTILMIRYEMPRADGYDAFIAGQRCRSCC
jgi:hypothetical protein